MQKKEQKSVKPTMRRRDSEGQLAYMYLGKDNDPMRLRFPTSTLSLLVLLPVVLGGCASEDLEGGSAGSGAIPSGTAGKNSGVSGGGAGGKASGGAPAGGATSGGAPSGGASNGGAPSGGASNG